MAERMQAVLPLLGRRALVTGASGRLGRAIALALGAAGATPLVHYRSDAAGADETVRLLATVGRTSRTLRADLSLDGACAQLVQEARAHLGGLDLLVNSAACFERAPLAEMDVEDFDLHMRSNARSVYELSLHAGRAMAQEGGGDIINLADIAAFRPWPAYIGYCASKAAVVNMTASYAKALAPTVRVNAVAPGPVLPPVGGDAAQGEAAIAATLLGRWGSPEDICAAVLFLLRARYVTGYTLAVDGGRSIA
jgi:NAD(P)-dependent dehydrogenase (short-subunit alcohol dehydrogenase family)